MISNMKYIRYTLNTTTKACESICYELTELGITALEIEDNIPVDDVIQGRNYEELLPDMPPDTGKCKIIFYMESDDSEIVSKIHDVLNDVSKYMDIGEGTLESEVLEDEDYLSNWKKYFHAFTVGNLMIKPTWEKAELLSGVNKCISIDPGITFGTGSHETTKLCIEGLQKHLQEGDNVLDIGFGSGILSIVALMYGANHVTGTDIDPLCMETAPDNLKVNNIDINKATFYIGDITSDKALQDKVGYDCYDIVTANILADIIIDMAPVIARTLKPGGILISSGIIDFKEDEVSLSLEDAGLSVRKVNKMGEWVSVIAVKK